MKGLAGALQKRATAAVMDEFMACKLCSQYHQTFLRVKYPAPTHSKKLRKKSTHEGVAVAVVVDPPQPLEKCFEVLSCEDKKYYVKYWDYDGNAVIDMLALLKSELRGDRRMEAARRL